MFDHVTVQVLPQSVRGYLALGDFSVLGLGDTLPATVQVDNAGAGMSMTDKPRDVGRFTRMFEALSRSALPAESTPDFLQQLTRGTQHMTTRPTTDLAQWRKSTYSGSGSGNNCVEVADLRATEHQAVAVRDSKNPDGAAPRRSAPSWRSPSTAPSDPQSQGLPPRPKQGEAALHCAVPVFHSR